MNSKFEVRMQKAEGSRGQVRNKSAEGRSGYSVSAFILHPSSLCLSFLLLHSSFLLSSTAAEPSCPSCEVSDAREAQYNKALFLTPAQKKAAESKHVAYGLPRRWTTGASPVVPGTPPDTSEHLLHQKDYLTWYDDDLRVPLWVAYKITKNNILRERDRVECFRPDPRLPTNATGFCTDYLEKTYDQGHLAPNADFKASEAMMINTYLYSNMAPQHDTFNRHTWERLESLVRVWTQNRGDLFVITGSGRG